MLQVDTFPARRGADQYPWSIWRFESFFSSRFSAMVATLQDCDALAWILLINFGTKHLHAAQIGREHYDPFLRILLPQHSQGANELLNFCFTLKRILGQQFLDAPAFFRQRNGDAAGGSVFPSRRACFVSKLIRARSHSFFFALQPQDFVSV